MTHLFVWSDTKTKQDMIINIVTRHSDVRYLDNVYQSIIDQQNKHSDVTLNWHIIVDRSKIGNSYSQDELAVKYYMCTPTVIDILTKEDDTYLHFIASKYCQSSIKEGWIVFVDDDNILHENYLTVIKPYLTSDQKRFLAVCQDNNYEVFNNIKIREVSGDTMKVSQVDLGQVTFYYNVFENDFIDKKYVGDSEFIARQFERFPTEFEFINRVGAYYNKSTTSPSRFIPTVLYIGNNLDVIKTWSAYEYNEKHMNIIYREDDSDLKLLQSQHIIEMYVTEEHLRSKLTVLPAEPIHIRRKWIEVPEGDNYKGNNIYASYIATIVENFDKQDLVSIFTSAFNTGKNILKVYHSIASQSYTDWEWVVVHDSSDRTTYEILQNIAKKDVRVKPYSFNIKSGGNIGEAKYRACMLCSGVILLELDHDDYLLQDACYHLIQAYKQFPEAGFFYSDSVELNKDYSVRGYGENWAFGYGRYRDEIIELFGRRQVRVPITPSVNPRTIRHIVGAPNHLRAWTRKFYMEIGGHNRNFPIADDYELILRTFLNTEMVYIPLTLYVQMFDGNNSQDKCRPEISRRVDYLRLYYNSKITNRFLQLGVQDWCSTEYEFLYTPSKIGIEEGKVNKVYIP